MNTRSIALLLTSTLALGACAVLPSGPSVMALPGTGKNFDQFRSEDYNCRQYAFGQVGGTTAQDNANASAVGSAAIGTALGAAAGAAFGGGSGAAVGAGVGLLTGAAVGAGNSYQSGYGTQQRYDSANTQCMYASGNRVPVYGTMASQMTPRRAAAVPPPNYLPYYPPPPPPGYMR